MPKLTKALFALLLSVLFISCEKETSEDNTGSEAPWLGNYKLVSISANTTTTQLYSSGGEVEKLVTTLNYITRNNSGTVKLDATTLTTDKLAYSVDTVARTKYYINNVLDDSYDMPFTWSAPAFTSTVPYRIVSADSIYFSEGNMFINDTNLKTEAAGARVKIEGNRVMLTAKANKNTTQNIQGEDVSLSVQLTSTITLEKL